MGIERRGMIVRKEFDQLLDLYLKDSSKIKLPARIELAALDSLELSREVTSNLDDQDNRKQVINKYFIDNKIGPQSVPLFLTFNNSIIFKPNDTNSS